MSEVKGARQLLDEARALLDAMEAEIPLSLRRDVEAWCRDHTAWTEWADSPAINQEAPR